MSAAGTESRWGVLWVQSMSLPCARAVLAAVVGHGLGRGGYGIKASGASTEVPARCSGRGMAPRRGGEQARFANGL